MGGIWFMDRGVMIVFFMAGTWVVGIGFFVDAISRWLDSGISVALGGAVVRGGEFVNDCNLRES